MMENNYLYLVWKSPLSGKRYIIGRLNRADEYSFEYSDECSMARKDGWEMLPSFPESKKYYSKDLFPAFSSRLPDRKRRKANVTFISIEGRENRTHRGVGGRVRRWCKTNDFAE